jgi:hypothetical protein
MDDVAAGELDGRELTNVRGERLGRIEALLTHAQASEATWARVKLGRLGLHKALVPLEGAQEVDGKLCLPYETEHVHSAPAVSPEGEELSDEQADLLCRHYGLERVATPSAIEEDDIELSREARDAKPPALEEGGEDLDQRRRERAEQLDLPDTSDQEPKSAEPEGQEPELPG